MIRSNLVANWPTPILVTYLTGKRNTRGSVIELGIFDYRPRSREPDCVDLITLCVLSHFPAYCASPLGTLAVAALSYARALAKCR
jgi:hypothetical protein